MHSNKAKAEVYDKWSASAVTANLLNGTSDDSSVYISLTSAVTLMTHLENQSCPDDTSGSIFFTRGHFSGPGVNCCDITV